MTSRLLHALRSIALLLFTALLCTGAASAATESISGDLSGSFVGTTDDGTPYSGAIEGRWAAGGTFTNSVFIENVTGSGTFGGSGIGGTWTMTGYNAQTKTISVDWAAAGSRGPGKGSADGRVSMVVDVASGTARGSFSGQIYTDKGQKTLTGTWTVQFQGVAGAEVTGRVVGNFTGSASYVGNVAGNVTGTWKVRVMPDGSIVGSASGRYDGGLKSVLSYGSVCICGDYQATLNKGSDGQYSLQGSWTHPVISGALEGSGGGPITWYIDVSTFPFQATGQFSGSSGFSVNTPFGNVPVSVSTQGTWQATLPFP